MLRSGLIFAGVAGLPDLLELAPRNALDVTTAQADVIEFGFGQRGEFAAGDPRVIPRGDRRNDTAKEGGAAHGPGHLGKFDGGHCLHPETKGPAIGRAKHSMAFI